MQAHQADNATTCDVTIFASHRQFARVQFFFTNCDQKSQERRDFGRQVYYEMVHGSAKPLGWWFYLSIRDKYEIWDPSTERVLNSEGSQVFLGLDVFFPCKALLQLHFRFPSPSYIKHYHSPKNWEIVGIWIFTLSPPVDLQVVARPPSGSQSRYAGASCKETWVKTAATVLQVQCLFCLYFKCCHSMSSEIGLPVRDQTFCKYQIPNELILNAPTP